MVRARCGHARAVQSVCVMRYVCVRVSGPGGAAIVGARRLKGSVTLRARLSSLGGRVTLLSERCNRKARRSPLLFTPTSSSPPSTYAPWLPPACRSPPEEVRREREWGLRPIERSSFSLNAALAKNEQKTSGSGDPSHRQPTPLPPRLWHVHRHARLSSESLSLEMNAHTPGRVSHETRRSLRPRLSISHAPPHAPPLRSPLPPQARPPLPAAAQPLLARPLPLPRPLPAARRPPER